VPSFLTLISAETVEPGVTFKLIGRGEVVRRRSPVVAARVGVDETKNINIQKSIFTKNIFD